MEQVLTNPRNIPFLVTTTVVSPIFPVVFRNCRDRGTAHSQLDDGSESRGSSLIGELAATTVTGRSPLFAMPEFQLVPARTQCHRHPVGTRLINDEMNLFAADIFQASIFQTDFS
jgi:hypothetical protein